MKSSYKYIIAISGGAALILLLVGIATISSSATSTPSFSENPMNESVTQNQPSTVTLDSVTNTNPASTITTASPATKSNLTASEVAANHTTNGYYPKAKPSSFFLRPNETFTISGSGFAPNEIVTLTLDNTTVLGTYVTGTNGVLSINQQFLIPWSFAKSTHTFTLIGNQSAYAIPMKITVGSFYPNIFPSSYYVGYSETLSGFGTGFAPNEPVQISINGLAVSQVVASNAGDITFTVTTPAIGSSFTLSAKGQLSGVSSSRTITLAR